MRERRTWKERRLAKKIRRAEDSLADLEHRLSMWGFGMKPSERRAYRDAIARAEAKLEELQAKRDA